MRNSISRFVVWASLFAVVPVFGGTALADKFPSKPFELVITSSAGSGVARWGLMMAEQLAKPGFLGEPVHVLFKGGGSGNESAVYTREKPADGYTILQISGSHAGYFNLPTMKYHFDQFKFVCQVQKTLYAIGVPGDSKFNTFQQVVDYAKAHPGELSMGSNKVGSIHHRMQTALFHKLGINIRFIPYKGTGRVVKDILGHHLPVGMAQPGLWAPHVKAGKAKVLLLLNDKRIPQMPNVPIPSDLGIKLNLPTQFQALIVRKETPEDRVKFIAAAFHKVMGTQAYKDYIKRAKGGQIPLWSDDTKELARNFREQIKEARKFMLENGILKK